MMKRCGAVRPRLLVVPSIIVVFALMLVSTLQREMRIPAANEDNRSLTAAANSTIEAHANLRWQVEKVVTNEPLNEEAFLVDWPPAEMLDALFDGATQTTPHSRRLVVGASNSDYVDFADNFANSLLALNVSNFVLVPLDEKAYQILHKAYPEHTLPVMPWMAFAPEGEAVYGSEAFKKLTATRPAFLRPLLEKGYTVLYNDIDMVWQRNAWDVIDEREKKIESTRVSTMTVTTTTSMLWHDGPNMLCTCVFYLLPTPDSISLLTQWEEEVLTGTHLHDQRAFNTVAERLMLPLGGGSTANGVRVFDNDEEFPRGASYSWNKTSLSNQKAVIIHNNWIKGKQAKRDRFEAAGLWNPSGRVPQPQ